ncbi:MAG: flagellar biosynthesis protein FlhB [Burkholderiales bacterium]
MAEGSDIERELPASQKRLDEARERGETARSRELSTALLMLVAAGGLMVAGPTLIAHAKGFLAAGLALPRGAAFDTGIALEGAARTTVWGFAIALPLLLALLVTACAAPLALGGWVFATEALAPKWSRLDPIAGIGKLFSWNALAELVKAIAKVALLGGVIAYLVWTGQEAFIAPLAQATGEALGFAGSLIARDFVWMAAVLILIAAIDVPVQLWQHARGLRMSFEEVKREAKETEGDPQLKGKRRARAREVARRRMMAAVPTADVVVTNPQHYAVALKYDSKRMGAPRVVAKGVDEVAARIRALAAEHDVPLMEAPPLARALYAHAEIDGEIPAALYNVVAQVLAWVYQLRSAAAGRFPATPQLAPLPPGLDPLETGVAS